MNKAVSNYMQNARPLRELYGYSQTYVAYVVGVSQSLYCKAENGQVKPTFSLVENLCSLYGISLIDFLGKTKKDLLNQVMNSDGYRKNRVDT
ncbi:MAG: helix-turn-helix transcriptional regulator [Stigonema ocellatum SAG 48.90 = DSM 106950]|nr:helix-turn-helix transcriptional regulator [Stigonema ocellatum SAG 48.90 = DSM 106950]